MTWRIGIRHVTTHEYERPVTSSYNEARITPISSDRQLALESTVDVSPPAAVYRYWDWWGTLVHSFDLHVAHEELVITGSSVVETSAPVAPPATPVTWADLAEPGFRDQYAELLSPSRYVPLDDDGVAAAAAELDPGLDPLAACDDIVATVRSHLRYERGSTTVSTTSSDALRIGAGVCQDFTHVALALLRSRGIPARYVSGYLHPSATAEPGRPVAGQSHAWVEAWVGDWVSLDPTNGGPVGERHVVVGRARDYADLAPLNGIFHGGPAKSLGVHVELTRLA
ncbi:MAG TPA: transglutaminase family protein [Acidimicrobiales bacterium]|nr:transglutaminase family protein [Acidimicrobiales bacterium]